MSTIRTDEWYQRADVAEMLGICPHHVSKRLSGWTGKRTIDGSLLVERRPLWYRSGHRPVAGSIYEYRLSREAIRRLERYRDSGGRPHPMLAEERRLASIGRR